MKKLTNLIIGASAFLWIGTAFGWVLVQEPSEGPLTALYWQDGNQKVPAVEQSILSELKVRPEVSLSSDSLYGILHLPRRSVSGLFYGGTLLLKPGATITKSYGVPSEVVNFALAEQGFYFTLQSGNKFHIRFFHAEAEENKHIETLATVSAAKVKSGHTVVELSPMGAIIQEGENVLTYLPGGQTVAGGYVFTDLSSGNVDIIEGKYSGIDLLEVARSGGLSPNYGALDSITRVVNTLFQRTRRNPLLWGQSGVGAEGVVHLLATMMAEDKIEDLKGWALYQMDWSVFETNGEVGITAKKLNELKANTRQRKVILYFPQVDRLIGLGKDTGGSGGVGASGDAADIMTPDISSGRIIMIGQTDVDGMGRMRAARAFYRAFDEIPMAPPTGANLAKAIKEKAAQASEEFKVTFSDRLIQRIIDMTDQYLPNESQPQKSFDVIVELSQQHGPANAHLPSTKPVAITIGMLLKLMAVKARIPGLDPSEELKAFLEKETFIAELSKIVVGHQNAKEALHRVMTNVVGGGLVSDPLGGGSDVQILMFTGPSGVGKTFVPSVLQKVMLEKTGLDWPLKQWDGGQYADKGAVNILFNAPPGYVGHNPAGGYMYQWVNNNPQSIMVFDELDKMNRAVHNSLYRLFDEGIVHDNGLARDAHFNRGVVFATSNFGSIKDAKLKVGEGEEEEEISINPRACDYIDEWDRWHIFNQEPTNQEVKTWSEETLRIKVLEKLDETNALSPQLVGRIGHENIVIFHHFTKPQLGEIGVGAMGRLAKAFKKSIDVTVQYTEKVAPWTLARAWGEDGAKPFATGARAILNVVDHHVAYALKAFMSENFDPENVEPQTWVVDIKTVEGEEQVVVTKQ